MTLARSLWAYTIEYPVWDCLVGRFVIGLPALVNVKKRVYLLACSVCVMRCTALSCLEILRPFRKGCSHSARRCGHESLLFIWHNVQLGFWCTLGQKMVFLWLPIYWAYLNFRV